ncbi:hypothetical protein H6F98_16935 [Microcoleus sp. FACHB-SPT15]|uniref:C1 family peptidase n=1 Tax=Microcoleus sp. FACHB-SPT15 TaxID=2692830 RepID=UPI0017855CCC|nr:C1 family peptidase [Microcoleus sp. FACHB-SPT15]MBD1807124.1 hypothetical protein [Microcoleus sp. FACHB-SPT15]
MENKQTGWAPDFPDVKDYTLKSKQIRKALQPIQPTQIIGSLESQKESVIRLLEQIVEKTEDNEAKKLCKELQGGMENEVHLVEAKLLELNEENYNSRTDKLAEFFDIERIPSKVFDTIVKKLFKDFGSDLVQLKEDNKGRGLTKVVYPIVKVIAQIMNPIGTYGNLSKAVTDKGIKYFKSLLETEFNNSYEKTDKILESLIQEIKELKKATERNYNFSKSSLQSTSSWKLDNKYFEYLAFSAMLKAKEELLLMKASLDLEQTVDLKIKDILIKVEKELEADFKNVLKSKALPFKKALEFDGNNKYEHIESCEWKQEQALTIEFWVKVNKDDFTAGSSFTFKLTTDQNYTATFKIILSSELHLVWEYGNKYLIGVDYSPYFNQWTYVALVSETTNDAEHTAIYMNGEFIAKKDEPLNPPDEDESFNVKELKITNTWKAEIARFNIWNQPWTEEDIRNNMFLPKDSEEKLTNYWCRVTHNDNENNPSNTGVPSGDTKPKIVTIKSPFSEKWMIKEDKDRSFKPFKKARRDNQTRFNIMPPQEEMNGSEEKDKIKSFQFIIFRKNLKKVTESTSNNKERLVGLAILPDFIDLSLWCSEIEDQGSLNSCTASAAIALMEYFQKKSFGKYIDGSRLFLYKATRNLMQIEGNVGTSIRNTMKAMALFGVPPEEYWPYDEAKVNVEPNPFCYSFAQSYQALKYFRLDPPGIPNEVLLAQIKAILVTGFPCVFGFTLYSSIYDESNPRGHIPYPHQRDKAEGGHAVVAVGYDDYKVIKNADDEETTGALLIRNSWGTKWGEGGYGWLPYDYVLKGLTADWWSLLNSEWFDTEQFGLGGGDWTDNVGLDQGKKPGGGGAPSPGKPG